MLLGTALLLLGIGLQGTLLSLRALQENFSVDMIGYIMSSYFIGFAIGTYLCPPLIRTVGHIRAYAAFAAATSSAAIAHVLAIDPYAWILLRIITGICMVGLYMVIESWLNALSPNHLRGQFFSAYMIITFIALALSQYLLLAGEISGFKLFAIIAILISSALIPIAMTRVQQPQLIETPILQLATIYHACPVGVVGTTVTGIVMGAFWGMMPIYGSLIGLDTTGIAILLSATIIGGAVLQWPIGKTSDHVDRRVVLAVTAFSAAGLSLLSLSVENSNPEALYVIFFLFGGFAFSLYSLSVAHVNDRLQPEQTLDASKSLLQLYGIGAVTGPFLSGLFMEFYGYRPLTWLFTVSLLTLGLFTVYRIFTYHVPPEETREPFLVMHRTTPVALEMDPRIELNEDENSELPGCPENNTSENESGQPEKPM
ncbi:MAG: MFS transporter [Sedimenticola sp.]